MKELFGIPTISIMFALLALLAVAVATVAIVGATNRTVFRMGIRNVPRRGLQSVLVVVGLALATLITTAAFVTGDTVDHSLTSDTYRLFGRSDLDITWNGERQFDRDAGAATEGPQRYVSVSTVNELEKHFIGAPDIAAFLPFLYERGPVVDTRTGQAIATAQFTGVDPTRLAQAGGLTLTNGTSADLFQLDEDTLFLSERAADSLDARVADLLTVHIGNESSVFDVGAIVKDEIASGMLGAAYSSVPGGVVFDLKVLQRLYGYENGEINSITVALEGSVRGTVEPGPASAARVTHYLEGEGSALFAKDVAGNPLAVEVLAAKADSVANSETQGNLFTTFFLVLGLFSMAAGVILIFMIFVMLAAERKSEMGMTRAVGAQRYQLVQSFLVEGMAYSLLAGLIGVAAGVAASLGLTLGLLKFTGGDYFSLVEAKVTPVSVIIGYSLGVVITFLTVVFASLKVSRINIVAAIRQLPEQKRREARRKTRWLWTLAGIPALIVPPLGAWMILRKGFGFPWAWILTPVGLALGALLMFAGKSSETLFLFALGISLLPLSGASLASHYGVPGRPLWTTVGALLGAYWLLPPATHDALFGSFASDIEMFVLSGVMVVVSFTLVIVFNATLLTRLFAGAGRGRVSYVAGAVVATAGAASIVAAMAMGNRANGVGELLYLLGGLLFAAALLSVVAARFPAMGPALKMGVAYPLANRFRTGMTIAMFSIIVFSLTVFSVLLANYDAAFLGGDARGNVDIVGTGTSAGAVAEFESALEAGNSPVGSAVAGWGLTTVGQPNQSVGKPGETPDTYPVIAANDAFYTSLDTTLESIGAGYASQQEVMQAVLQNPGFALVDSSVLDGAFNDSYTWAGGTTEVKDGRFEPFDVVVMDAVTGKSQSVTIIGTLKIGLASSAVAGVYVNEETYESVFGEPSYQRFYIRLADGTDASVAAQELESALATSGIEADSVQELLDAASGQSKAFNRMFQAFMALGLVVGIAGLGVVAFRSVVERRQQIGMLRAIGYQRASVSLTFLLESSFVASMGILSGVVGGAILGRNLLTSDSFTGGAEIPFSMPWAEVLTVVFVSMLFSLLMTWWPSRGASRVPVAEALRYE